MPAGVAYGYQHKMLFDSDEFNLRFINHDEDCQYYEQAKDDSHIFDEPYTYSCPDCGKAIEYEWSDDMYEDFKTEVAQAFRAEEVAHVRNSTYNVYGNNAHIFAVTDRLAVGIDTSGDLSCLFVVPALYGKWYDQKEYNIRREVERAFKKLRKMRPQFYYYARHDLRSSQGVTMASQYAS